jgi:hypothetical protein
MILYKFSALRVCIDGILKDFESIHLKCLLFKIIYVQHSWRYVQINYFTEFIYFYCIGNYKYKVSLFM